MTLYRFLTFQLSAKGYYMVAKTYVDLVRPQPKAAAWAFDLLLVMGASFLISLSNFIIRIPLSGTPVPVTGQTFAVLMLAALLGAKRGAAAVLLYLAYGVADLPFYSGGLIAGPTGGYLIGFVGAALAVGFLCEQGLDRRHHTAMAAMLVGNIVLYIPGLIWLSFFVGDKAFVMGLFPYIPGDLLKIGLASALLPLGWKFINRLEKK
jgi:biotin transporter BioY